MERVKRKPTAEVMPVEDVRLMLDSGAFTAWSQNKTIDIQNYIRYIKENKHKIHTYVNLDVIPGSPGRRATPSMVEESAAGSYKNLQVMKKSGLTPIPVFHMGERVYWLERLIDDGHDYIGISPATEASTPEIIDWLDKLFTGITDSAGRAKIKTHGFGVASFPIIKRYPWHTCDAASWALTAAYGSVYIPIYRGKEPDYSCTPVKLTVSQVDRKHGLPPDHWMKQGPLVRARVEDFLENYVGVTIKQVSEGDAVYKMVGGKRNGPLLSGDEAYVYRAHAIVFFMLKFQKAIGDVRFQYRTHRLLK